VAAGAISAVPLSFVGKVNLFTIRSRGEYLRSAESYNQVLLIEPHVRPTSIACAIRRTCLLSVYLGQNPTNPRERTDDCLIALERREMRSESEYGQCASTAK
jgi:hypothetical protein